MGRIGLMIDESVPVCLRALAQLSLDAPTNSMPASPLCLRQVLPLALSLTFVGLFSSRSNGPCAEWYVGHAFRDWMSATSSSLGTIETVWRIGLSGTARAKEDKVLLVPLTSCLHPWPLGSRRVLNALISVSISPAAPGLCMSPLVLSHLLSTLVLWSCSYLECRSMTELDEHRTGSHPHGVLLDEICGGLRGGQFVPCTAVPAA
jgi:hypothetical protein